MNFRTLVSLLRGGQISVLRTVDKAARNYHRVAFLASGLHSGLLHRLATGPTSLEVLAAEFQIDVGMQDGLETWLQAGVALGELQLQPNGYTVCGKLSRMLTDPKNDAAAAFVEELAYLHNALFTQAPKRMQENRPFTLAEQDARMIARSSRLVEPFIHEALADVIPAEGPFRLLEIGCGSAAYIRWAALQNRELTAVGVELQDDAAALASENIARWNLQSRVSIEAGDIRKRPPAPSFDLATLHQNIYYFPVAERVRLLAHVRSFLKKGGHLLLTVICRGRGSTAAALDLWGAMTQGCGRLPRPTELVDQLETAGFVDISATCLLAETQFYAFVGTNPEDR